MMALADVGIAVSDAKLSAKWWKDKLGFSVHHLEGNEHAVLIAPPGERFLLHLCQGFEEVDPGNTGIAFMTDDIEGVVARMEKAGVRFPEPLKKEEWGASAKFADPDGNVFWLMGSPRGFIRKAVALRAPARGGGATKGARKKAAKRPSGTTKAKRARGR